MTNEPLPDAPVRGELTRCLDAAAGGDRAAFDRAFALLYDELARLAHAQRRRWVGNETFDTTVLVHEAYLKLLGADDGSSQPNGDADAAAPDGVRWSSRRHFFAIASRAMRQLLVNYAERQRAAKRGGDEVAVPLDALGEAGPDAPRLDAEWLVANDAAMSDSADEILALHAALQQLAERDARQARIVECRFFGGLSIPETAEALGISAATVKRDWQSAREWLYAALPRVREELSPET
ncbi:MAG: ECF-type sigma factor [Gemmatimonadaceae bacterium]